MNICFAQQFHLDERMGGAEVQAWLLAVELARRGHQVSYIAESLSDRAGRSEFRDGVRIEWLPRQPLIEVKNLGLYYRALKRLEPDVVIQRSTSMYTAVAATYAKRRSVPFLWICTDDSLPFRWAFFRQQQEMNRRYRPTWWKRPVLLGIAAIRDVAKNHGIRNTTHAATQNSFQAASLLKEFGRTSHHFHSGHPCPPEAAQKDTRPLVLWVGDISYMKRPELFVELADACRDLDVRFAMICKKTGGKDADRGETLARHGEQNPNFEWVGATPLEETNRWFGRAALYVSTSAPGGDGFPNTFVQAWLRRTPVLTFGTDPDQIVARRGYGRVVQTVAEAREALVGLLNSPERGLLGRKMESYARSRHSIESVADNTAVILQGALGPVIEIPPVPATALVRLPAVALETRPALRRPRLREARSFRVRQFRDLQEENARLRKLVADLALEKQQLAELVAQPVANPLRERAPLYG